ncbi:MAG: glycosyltransferase [Cyanobium sp. PLM2.Bin73]|nr:MAG: glycosyltransferase [Cyanobium sp. PLM2.Bin73]
MKLLIYDTEMRTANGYLPQAIAMAAGKLLGRSNVHLCGHHQVVEQAASGAWNGLLAIGGAGADRHLMAALMETSIPRILWTTEDPYERRLLERTEPAFDHIFSNEESCEGVSPFTSFLPLAAEPDLHWRPVLENDSDYVHDLTFVGTAWPNRVASLRRILAELPLGLNVFLCLPWNRHIPKPRLPGVGVLPQLRLDITDLCDIWNRSRVVLTIGREFSNAPVDSQVLGVSPPPRIYETALAGGRQIVLGGPRLQLPGAFPDLIPVVDQESAAAALIQHDLADPAARITAARATQNHTLSHHTYEQRLRVVLTRFAELRSQQRRAVVQMPGPPQGRRFDPTPHPSGVLHVAHNLVGLRRSGGTELYVDQLARWQQRRWPERTVLALAPKDSIRLALMGYRQGRPQLLETLKIGQISRFSSSNQNYERAFCQILSHHGVGVVHIHHLIGLPLSLPLFAKALGCRVVVTLHDFHLLCHRYTLQRPDGTFCRVHEHPDHRLLCRLCLQASGLDGEARNRRLEISRRSMAAVDRVLASTNSSAAIARGVYPELADRLEVLEMVTPDVTELDRGRHARPAGIARQGPLRVGVIGNAVPHKGLDTLVQVIRASGDLPLEFHILGATPELDQCLREAGFDPDAEAQAGDAAVARYEGTFTRAVLVSTLQRLHVALFLSSWPETYHIALGEAMRMGVVPVATHLGAHRDRIEDGVNGVLVPPQDPHAVLQALLKLEADRSLLGSLSQAAASVSLMEIEQHGVALEQIYAQLQPWRGTRQAEASLQLDPQLDLAALGVRLAHERWHDPTVRWDEPT